MELFIQFFLYLFGSIGLTFVLVDSDIAEPIRTLSAKYLPWKFKDVFNCYLCTGVWAGWLIGSLTLVNSVGTFLCCGFTTAILAMLTALVINLIEAKTIVIKD